ncbi:cobalamin-independent methionine synthase II family protein [Novosphingobium aquimarinum]|uniref:cobalamin-independent methionine synthase II family protein n=1 Tax=Novosphingobium aquimarinum TaxID=2682494 RepID=UPI0012EC0EF7|nr:cobalamin-independent methionine synthase II family protein [Novosphingobium aquimarinum]
MRRSTDHILTTHGGNLPRPADLDELLVDADSNGAAIEERLPKAVNEVVEKQIECGLDVINDGEYVKAANMGSYTGYIDARVKGWEMRAKQPGVAPKRAGPGERDKRDFPGFFESGLWFAGAGGPVRPGFMTPGKVPQPRPNEKVCTAKLEYVGQDAIAADIAALKKGLEGREGVDGFIAALGPLSAGAGARNEFYDSEEDYMFAVAEAMREEYKAITDAGLVVQLDEPEFATTWMFYPDWSVEDYRRYLEFAVEVINHAIAGLPSELVRFHMCWGSGHRPHTNDIEFRHIVDLLFKIDAQCYTFEASNVRHAHEYHVFEEHKLPDGKIIAPGVVGHHTDLVEHPELVAERLMNFGRIVGMENLQGATDCGIGSRVGHPEIVWAKLSALADGAAIASERLKAGR